MRVRITKAFSGYRIGQEFDWADGMARIYVGRGMVEPVDVSAEGRDIEQMDAKRSEPEVIEEQMVEPKVERTTTGGRRKPK
jgi:hypothetical protein